MDNQEQELEQARKKLEEAKARQKKRQVEQAKRDRKWEREWRERERWVNEYLIERVRLARPEDYKRWLVGYLSSGGQVRYVRDYPMRDFYILTKNVEMRPLYGAMALDLIVPEGLTLEGELGHCSVCRMDGFTFEGSGVEVFSDINL